MCAQSGQCQCPSDLVPCEVTVSQIHGKNRKMVNSSELSPNVNSLDIAIKTRAENLTKTSCYSSQKSCPRTQHVAESGEDQGQHECTTPFQPSITIFLHLSPNGTLHGQLRCRKIHHLPSTWKTQPWDKAPSYHPSRHKGSSPISNGQVLRIPELRRSPKAPVIHRISSTISKDPSAS